MTCEWPLAHDCGRVVARGANGLWLCGSAYSTLYGWWLGLDGAGLRRPRFQQPSPT